MFGKSKSPQPTAYAAKCSPAHRFFSTTWFVIQTAALCYIFVLIAAMALENQLVYMPEKYPHGDWSPPLPVEDVYFTSVDGTPLHGWYWQHPNSIAPILFLHGVGGNVTQWLEPLWGFHEAAGTSILVFDYRGFGRSAGRPTESGLIADARAARQFLAEKEQTGEEDVVLVGRSLGGGVALQLAAQDGARAVILERTFTSLPAAAANCYPFFPTQQFMRNRFDSLTAISHYRGPLLQSHGTSDTTIPFAMGESLFAAAASSRKEFIAISGGRHNDAQPDGYYRRVREFLLQ